MKGRRNYGLGMAPPKGVHDRDEGILMERLARLHPAMIQNEIFQWALQIFQVMFSVESHHPLLSLRFNGGVDTSEMASCLGSVEYVAGSMRLGFCLLIDLTGLDHMHHACATDLGRIMDLCNERGVAKIVSIIPDSTKDIGIRLLALFHCHDGVRMEVFGNLPEAMGSLPEGSLACDRRQLGESPR